MDTAEMRAQQEAALARGDTNALADNRYGAVEIAENKLLTMPVGEAEGVAIYWRFPEFTCLCPRSGYPDFATIHVWWVPRHVLIELKTVKLYLNSFRDAHIFHEAVPRDIRWALTHAADPHWMRVTAEFSPRGNLTTIVTDEHNAANYRPSYEQPAAVLSHVSHLSREALS